MSYTVWAAKLSVVVEAARVPLGLALLLAERIRADLGVRTPPPVGAVGAFAIGMGDAAVSAARRAAGAAAQRAVALGRRPASSAVWAGRIFLEQPGVARATAPVRRAGFALANRADVTVVRGRLVADAARADALAFLRAQSDSGMAWVRGEVLPTIIDDLVIDPKVRELAVEQAHGALSDAAREVRHRSAGADARLEARVHRLFGMLARHEPSP